MLGIMKALGIAILVVLTLLLWPLAAPTWIALGFMSETFDTTEDAPIILAGIVFYLIGLVPWFIALGVGLAVMAP